MLGPANSNSDQPITTIFCIWPITHETYAVKACTKFVLMTRTWNTTKLNFHHTGNVHYSDVIMSVMAFQITCVSTVCLTFCSGADQRKQQSSMSLASVGGIHWWLVNSPHKGPVTWKMFPFDDVIMEWKSSEEMGPRTLKQPNLRKVDLLWKIRTVSPLIDILRSRLSINQLSILWISLIHVYP